MCSLTNQSVRWISLTNSVSQKLIKKLTTALKFFMKTLPTSQIDTLTLFWGSWAMPASKSIKCRHILKVVLKNEFLMYHFPRFFWFREALKYEHMLLFAIKNRCSQKGDFSEYATLRTNNLKKNVGPNPTMINSLYLPNTRIFITKKKCKICIEIQ